MAVYFSGPSGSLTHCRTVLHGVHGRHVGSGDVGEWGGGVIGQLGFCVGSCIVSFALICCHLHFWVEGKKERCYLSINESSAYFTLGLVKTCLGFLFIVPT